MSEIQVSTISSVDEKFICLSIDEGKTSHNTYHKKQIPKALRRAVWEKYHKKKYYQRKCQVRWCPQMITPFDFECGHNIPESKGGETVVENLRPICSLCNKSMGDRYSIDEWNKYGKEKSHCCIIC
jgi:5-methylcytosine-specific restriction endonuclease McrA